MINNAHGILNTWIADSLIVPDSRSLLIASSYFAQKESPPDGPFFEFEKM